MTKTINIHGTEKEVKFVRVNEDTGHLSVYFTDMTFVAVDGVKIIVEAAEKE